MTTSSNKDKGEGWFETSIGWLYYDGRLNGHFLTIKQRFIIESFLYYGNVKSGLNTLLNKY